MVEGTTFQPNWLSPPGETIAEIMATCGLSMAEFARRIGASSDTAEGLTVGSTHIDQTLAERLHGVLGPSAEFWMNREAQYRADAARLTSQGTEMSDREWVQHLPVRDMVRFGWIGAPNGFAAKREECLRFFAVPDVATWHRKYQGVLSVAAFRTSSSFPSSPGAVSAWLRWAELKSQEIACGIWNTSRFRDKLTEIKALTRRKDPGLFLPALTRMCAECGVALVVAPAPTGCRASGATWFLNPQKALIVLSFRYRSDDQFWFTFFHEAGHLILHGADALFLEDGSDATIEEEAEANEFAARVLIPAELVTGLMKARPQVREIIRLAAKAGVSPGIVVGQLQHLGRIGRDRFNSLKRRYAWNVAVTGDLSP